MRWDSAVDPPSLGGVISPLLRLRREGALRSAFGGKYKQKNAQRKTMYLNEETCAESCIKQGTLIPSTKENILDNKNKFRGKMGTAVVTGKKN